MTSGQTERRLRGKQRERQADRVTGRQSNRQTEEKEAKGQADGVTGWQRTSRQKDSPSEVEQIGRGMGLQRDVVYLTNSALVYESKCGGMGVGGCGVSANEYIYTQEPK